MTTGGWTALALPSVRRPFVAAALRERGTEWASVAHVTATTTLARAIRAQGQVGLPLATLLDMVVLPSLRGGMALPLDGFPGPGLLADEQGERSYLRALGGWQSKASAGRLLTGIRFDDSLRAFVREEETGRVGRALLASRRDLATTVHTLIAAGLRPGGLRPSDEVGAAAARAWERAESDIEWLGDPRENLWLDHDEIEEGSTPAARDLLDRVRAALDTAFGQVEGRRTVVHHGFYFYTPPQWAMFQVLRRTPGVDQVFVVHDDGRNPAFSTWRHYFRSDLSMPVPQRTSADEAPTPAAAALNDVLLGRRPDDHGNLRVVECKGPADLVRMWIDESPAPESESGGGEDPAEDPVDDGGGPARYAAAAEQVERYVQRLGRAAGTAPPPLAQLPVGSFLLAVHRCIAPRAGGLPGVRLDDMSLLDIVASGYLDLDAGVAPAPARVRRVLPYFADCVAGEEWIARAGLLVHTVRDRVAPMGARLPGSSDRDRIAAAVANPTRLVPWADVSVDDAESVAAAIRRVVALVSEIGSRERVRLGSYLQVIQGKLARALDALPEVEREAIEAKLKGLGVLGDEEIDVDGLVDVVAMLVSRTADVDPGARPEDDPAATSIKQLRGLDALGLDRIDADLHLANLAEDAFPTSGRVVGWPFAADDLGDPDGEDSEPVTLALLALRSATATLGDLYLFWLALDGVEKDRQVTLSWISQTDGDHRRLSPIVALLTRPQVRSDPIRARAGGLPVEKVPALAELPSTSEWTPPAEAVVDDDTVEDAIDMLAAAAVASAYACSRRFAIQWGLGPSAAFGPQHLQQMLYGNVLNGLQRSGLVANAFEAFAVTNPLWPQLTKGQRASSLERASVKPSGRSANLEWTLTLDGKRDRTGRMDKAYEAAREEVPPDCAVVAPASATYLPLGVTPDDAEVCGKCPVQARCAQWQDPRALNR